MITRDQLIYIEKLRKVGGNLFSKLPQTIIYEIGKALPSRSDAISKALDHAANAQEEAVSKLLTMLNKDPSLVLQAGNVTTRGGNTIIGVTLYEFLLGEGDPEFAAMIANYFDRINDGEAERNRQYDRYKPYINEMPNQKPYDLEELFRIIIDSSDEHVTAALEKKFDLDNKLNNALKEFREKHGPRDINKPCMHYNYKTLELALKLFDDNWNKIRLNGNSINFDKYRLVAWQLIGFLQLVGLPAVDRFAFAKALQNNIRSVDYIYVSGQFPNVVSGLSSHAGLGFDKYIFGEEHGFDWKQFWLSSALGKYKEACQKKISALQNLCSNKPKNRQYTIATNKNNIRDSDINSGRCLSNIYRVEQPIHLDTKNAETENGFINENHSKEHTNIPYNDEYKSSDELRHDLEGSLIKKTAICTFLPLAIAQLVETWLNENENRQTNTNTALIITMMLCLTYLGRTAFQGYEAIKKAKESERKEIMSEDKNIKQTSVLGLFSAANKKTTKQKDTGCGFTPGFLLSKRM